MSANEKPSERAAMYLLTCKEFWQTIISITKKAGGDHAIESNTLHAFIAFSIDRVTGCDSLAEENQRLRGVLERIKVQAEALERNLVVRVFAQEVYHRVAQSIVKDSLKIAREALKK